MRSLLPWLAMALLGAGAASAAGPLSFQHGGRCTAEVGACVARADQPVAMSYNPAAIAHLKKSQYQLGADFGAPIDKYSSSTIGSLEGDHVIEEAPAFYATWHLPDDYTPWAFGVGLDSPANYIVKWLPRLFPGRFLNNWQRLDLLALHGVVAYELGPEWSIGAGVRYYHGDLEQGNAQILRLPGTGGQLFDVEASRLAKATGTGYGFDGGVHFQSAIWGWGLTVDSGGKVSGGGHVDYTARDVPEDPRVQAALDTLLRHGHSDLDFKLPMQVNTGFSVAPVPEFRLELDAAWAAWSNLDHTSVTYDPNVFGPPSGLPVGTRTETNRRDWKDTISVRLGAEGDLGEHWRLEGGVGFEPSPIPKSTLEPGFPRGGDAYVTGFGFGYKVANVNFDIAYSYYFYDSTHVGGQELQHPSVQSTYKTKDQQFGASASWHF